MRSSTWIGLSLAAVATVAGCESGKTAVESSRAGDIAPSVSQLAGAKQNTISDQAQTQIEPVALFYGPAPTGVAVSRGNRIFVNFPRWGDPVEYSVAELLHGQAVPYPNALIPKLNTQDPSQSFVSPQSVVFDGNNRLWVLDTGSINFQPVIQGAPKLVAINLASDNIVRTITFPSDVCLPTTYLNDVRFDLSRGTGGMAYISDSSGKGPNAIIVVDLATGHSWRRLNGQPSVTAEPHFVANVEGQPFMARPGGGQPDAYIRIGVDGIALSPDGHTLYYTAMSGHHLYSVDAYALSDQTKSESDVEATVKDLGDRGFASDGLLCDASGTLYLTDYEHNAIRTRKPDGTYSVLVSDPRMIWPDSMSIGGDGYLYVTCNQLNRSPAYHDGKDLRKQPYALFRVDVRQQGSHPGGTS